MASSARSQANMRSEAAKCHRERERATCPPLGRVLPSVTSRLLARLIYSMHRSKKCAGVECLGKTSAPLMSLLCIYGTHGRIVIHLNPTSLLLCAVVEGQLPTPLVLRHTQPEPHQMPPHSRPTLIVDTTRRVVRICSPRVKDMRVAEELNVPWIQDHV